VLFLVNMFWLDDGDEPHHWVGYALFAILTVRLIWAFVGRKTARLKDFYPSVSRVKHHWQLVKQRQADPQEGHNPLGGLMILLLWLSLIVSSVSGYMYTTDMFWGEDWVELLHFYSVWFTMGAVVLHVSAVIFLQFWLKLSLILPMISGSRKIKSATKSDI